MKNHRLHFLLRECGLNPTVLAERILSNRAHVTMVLNNAKGRGVHTRKRLAEVLKDFKNGAEILNVLGWDPKGNLLRCCEGGEWRPVCRFCKNPCKTVPRGEFQVTSLMPKVEEFASPDGGALQVTKTTNER